MTPIVKFIADYPVVPKRLRGCKITILVGKEERKLRFAVEVPEKLSKVEEDYLKLTIKQYVDELRVDYPFIGTEQEVSTSE